ncbi:Ras subfamily protein [Acanthamoeba castellanii str. Neff]|uniref:Mitochondrial Rho GTPase n=1 Tax=Acanthamoeba castellanii (strain ATCC 30010 / Neff) TaxID=1257118 RepID=L8HK91_ACACF|nr:Ras subfamily protein [Acanthamoeba castellanii str. Neff]ELR24831.1 Ras subfamily protein [Acanthamoeba castellanii str. Neff]
MKDQVRIVLIGDDGAGKTSLIATLLADSFQEVHKMDQQLRTADVVCLCYAADSENVAERITHWLRHIRHTRQECRAPQVPVILVGNKIDLRGEDLTNPKLQEDMEPIMEEFKEVETCIECSAKSFLNVHEVFYFAQRAVLYPTAVLYDAGSRSLREECVAALKRIFKLCDKDRDGILSDDELNAFQARCFGASLDPAELQGVKDVVRGNVENGLTEKGLTLTGFLFLHHLFIQKGRLETTWTVLRQFGYDDNLRVDVASLCHSLPAPPPSHVYELSQAGVAFFSSLHRAFDKGAGLALDDLDDLFSTAAPGLPALWTSGELDPATATQLNAAHISLRGWLALWSYTTVHDHKTTLEYLAWLGFESDPQLALALKPRREASALLCLVVGSPALTDAFLGDFLGKRDHEPSHATSTSITTTTRSPSSRLVALGSLPDISGTEKYVAMRKYGLEETEALRTRLHEASLVIVLYDSSDSRSLSNTAHAGAELNSLCRNRDTPILHLALHHTATLMLQQDGATVPDLSENGIHLEAFASYSTLLIKAHQLARREQEWQWLPTWPQAALLGAVAVLVGGILLYRHFKGSKQA